MSTICASTPHPSLNESRLIEEAIRRARASRFTADLDLDSVEEAIISQFARGARTMHDLVRAVGQIPLAR